MYWTASCCQPTVCGLPVWGGGWLSRGQTTCHEQLLMKVCTFHLIWTHSGMVCGMENGHEFWNMECWEICSLGPWKQEQENLLTVPFTLCCSTKIEGHHHLPCFLHSWPGHIKIYFAVSTGSTYTKNTHGRSWHIPEFLFMLSATSCIEVQVNNATKKNIF
jgi:hypothetical protein